MGPGHTDPAARIELGDRGPAHRASQVGEFNECCDHIGDHPVLSGHELITEVSDPAQARRQLDLDAMRRGQIDGVIRIESKPNPLIGHVIARESLVQESACDIQEFRVPTTHNDPSKRARLPAKKRRAVGLDDDASNGIGGEGKSVAPEPVDRNCNLDMLQEGSQPIRIIRIVAPRREVEP